MLAWHLAATLFLFRWIFRDPKVDVRFLAAGAILPDLADLGMATVAGWDRGQLWAHSLLSPTVAAVAVLVITRRGRRRRAWMALVVAWLFHLLIDRMWLDERVFLWPLFGWRLVEGASGSIWVEAWARAMSDPWRWVLEAVGLTYLVWLAVASGLDTPHGRAELATTGRLGSRPPEG